MLALLMLKPFGLNNLLLKVKRLADLNYNGNQTE
jgi:hypothetical protein